ncbi:MAG TPA: hypothetical protein PKO28_00705 [Bacilli bacterium]|nr:hypothetical protein [Bacilli bacterium]HPS19042.1 hypothetical protein [Bacilli bacterium]
MRFTLPSLLLSILFGALFLVTSFIRYKNKYKVTYNVRNMFPYELNYKSPFAENFYGNVSLILAILSSCVFFFTFDLKFDNGFFIMIFISGIISSILFIAIAFIPLDFIRLHSALFILYMIFSFLLPTSISIGSYVYNQQIGGSSPIPFIIFIIAFIITLVTMVLLLNPKLTLNLRMKEEIAPDGSIKYVRPNIITMAFTEWLLFFFLFANEILVFVLSLAF